MATVLVNAGRAIITNRIKGAGTEPLNIGWGTGTQTTATATDTGLGPTTVERLVDLSTAGNGSNEARTAGTSTQQTTSVTNDTYRVVGTRTATGGGTVTVAGLFDATSGGNLFIKGDFAGIPLLTGDSIQFTFNLQFT